MEKPVIILGAGSIGKLALEIFQSNGVEVYCFLDDDKKLHQTMINEVTVMGSTDDSSLLKVIGKECESFVATDDRKLKENLTDMLVEDRKSMPVNCIHKTSYISPSAEIGHGNLISVNAAINTGAKVGSHCILHSGAIIDFESTLGDYVLIGAGSIINSGVSVGEGAFIGSGVTIVSGVTIGKKARIGAGSVVIENVKDGATVFGNPAKVV